MTYDLQDTAGHAQNKAGQAKEEGKGYLQTAQEKAGQLFGQTQDKAHQAKGDAKDTLGSTADKAGSQADHAHKEGKGESYLETLLDTGFSCYDLLTSSPCLEAGSE